MATKRTAKFAKAQARINRLEERIRGLQKDATRLRAKTPGQPVADYPLAGSDGKPTRLSRLFGDRDDLILVHNMGKSCPYCTMWADGFNGVIPHIERRAAFVVASPDDVRVQRKLAKARGWRFRMVSSRGTRLFRDMGFEGRDGSPWPGVTAFHRTKSGEIERVGQAQFGPGDRFCSVFSFFELLAKA